jgi:hypothetical protein
MVDERQKTTAEKYTAALHIQASSYPNDCEKEAEVYIKYVLAVQYSAV